MDTKTINELIEKLRKGRLSGTIQISIDNKGRLNEIIIRNLGHAEEIDSNIRKVNLTGNSLRDTNFTGMDISGSDFSGLDIGGSDFSYSRIVGTNLSGSDFGGANFYKARISQSDVANSYGIRSLEGSYMTGSVNLYQPEPEADSPISNPYDELANQPAEMPDDTHDINRILLHKRNY